MDARDRSGFPLGVGAPPSDAAGFARRVRATLRDGIDGARVEGLEDDAVAAALSGFDVDSLEVNLTGSRLVMPEAPDRERAEADVAARTVGRGLLRAVRIVGEPLLIGEAPVTLRASADEAPIRWARRSDDVLELRDDLDAPSDRARASLHLSIEESAVSPLLEAVGRVLAADGVRLAEPDVAFADAGPDAVALAGSAHLGMGAFSARVSISAVVRVLDGVRVRVEDVDIRSRNILAAAALAAVRDRIVAELAQEIEIREHLPAAFTGARVSIRSRDGGLELDAEVNGDA